MACLQMTTSDALPLFFNVSANTGRGCANRVEDVALVGFLLKRWGSISSGPNGEKLKAMSAKLTMGIANEAYYQCIEEAQRQIKAVHPQTKVDGYVTRAGAGVTYNKGSAAYTICTLNWSVANSHVGDWPRLDKFPDCPPQVRALVVRTMLV